MYPSWQQGGFRECIRPSCTRIRDIGDRTGYCPPHSSRYRVPDPTVPEVQEYIERLIAAGASAESIAKAAKISYTTVRELRSAAPDSGYGMFVKWSIVGVDPEEAIWHVPRWRVSRRLRSLVAAGVQIQEIDAFTGFDPSTTRSFLSEPRSGHVSIEMAQPVFDLWDMMEGQPVRPYGRSIRLWMRERQWPVPAAWDDIDAPDCDPTPNVVIPPETALPSLSMMRSLVDHHGMMLASRFTGQTAAWLRDVVAEQRSVEIKSLDFDVAVSAMRREHQRLAARRRDARRRDARRRREVGHGVGDAAAVPFPSA